MNFDNFMIEQNNKFVLKSNSVEHIDSLEIWVEGDILRGSLENEYLGKMNMSFCDLNKTEVSLSAEAQTATIGTVSLP